LTFYDFKRHLALSPAGVVRQFIDSFEHHFRGGSP
jgi:hypothetical protein